MRTFLRGCLLGVVFSMLRAPRGLDLFEMPAAASGTALLWRAAALAIAGVALLVALRRPGFGMIASAAFGFALHAFVLAAYVTPGSTLALVLTCAVAVVLALAVCLDERKLQEEPEPAHKNRSAFVGELIGLFAAGAGAALAIEAVARHVRLFGAGSSRDDGVFGFTFLALAALGALAFGPLARWKKLRGASLPIGLALAAVACFLSLDVVRELIKTPVLGKLVARLGAGLIDHGTFGYDLAVGATLLAAPALALGFALAGARDGRQACALFAGAAQGVLLSGSLLASDASTDTTQSSMFAAQLVPAGALLCVAGAALAVLGAAGLGKVARYAALAVVLALTFVPLSRDTLGLPVCSPWDESRAQSPRTFQLSLDVPEGLLTVESTPSGALVATLDRRVLSTSAEEAIAEAERVSTSIACVSPQRRAAGALRVLLVGQLDPPRAAMLGAQGVTAIDRTASWHAAMERIERKLFDTFPRPQGEILAPKEARERLAAGRYDLVIVPPVDGDAPRTRGLDVPEQTTLVAWIFADAPIARAALDEDVVLSSDGISQPAIALTRHAYRTQERTPAAPHFTPSGDCGAAELPLAALFLRDSPRDRSRSMNATRRSFERLALAAQARADDSAPFLRALADLAAAQEPSSPFEKEAQQTELPDHVLDGLGPYALAHPPDAFVRSVWSGIARLLAEKRDIERLRKHVEPLAAKYKPWPELEKALASADIESLDPASAITRLESVAAVAREDFELWTMLATAKEATGDVRGASAAWARALELRPTRTEVKRKLAIALRKIDDERGLRLIEELLKETPDDTTLRAFLGPRPWPE